MFDFGQSNLGQFPRRPILPRPFETKANPLRPIVLGPFLHWPSSTWAIYFEQKKANISVGFVCVFACCQWVRWFSFVHSWSLWTPYLLDRHPRTSLRNTPPLDPLSSGPPCERPPSSRPPTFLFGPSLLPIRVSKVRQPETAKVELAIHMALETWPKSNWPEWRWTQSRVTQNESQS